MQNNRDHIHEHVSLSEVISDGISHGMGSFRFLILQTIFVALWIAANTVGFVYHWDVFPYILLNLLFSTQAAYAAPIILQSQNRQAARDRRRDDHEAQEVSTLMEINTRQLEILQSVHVLQKSLDTHIRETVYPVKGTEHP